MARRTEHHFENLGRQVEDPDVTRLAKEAMAVSESQTEISEAKRRAANVEPGGIPRSYEDEEEQRAGEAIPPLPQAKPIPGHSNAVTEERLSKQATESPRAREAMPVTGNYGDVDEHDLPNGPESKKTWPMALLSGAAAAPVAALRLAGHLASKVGCRLGVLRRRGQEKWQGLRDRTRAA